MILFLLVVVLLAVVVLLGVFSKPKKRVATDSEKAVIGTLIRHQDGEKLQMVLSNVKSRVAVKD